MLENYDELIVEMGQQEPDYTDIPQGAEMTPAQKEQFAARMKAERDNLSELAMTVEMEIVGSGELFKDYLTTLARFDRYSTQNTILIYAQCPEAVKLGDYDHWKAAGTPVSRGETGIRIFEPGKEYLREDKTIGTSMNIKHVFDISQTAARNKLQPTTSKHDIRALLKALMHKSPAPVKLVDTLNDANGARYNEQSGVIEVVKGLDGESLFRCLAQEIAYAQLDRLELDHREPDEPVCMDKGFSAYAASYALCVKNGIDARGFDFADAPDYFADRDGKEVRGEIKAIRDTVNEVAGRMAKTLEPPQREARKQEVRA